jgi:hypothetical protein
MVPTPAIELSDEVLSLFSRAEHASANARRLLDENDHWRRRVLQQLDYMFELSAEFSKPLRITPPGNAVPGRLPALLSGRDAAPIR